MADRDEYNLSEAFNLARDALKSLILVNGGAVVALLTFYGSLIKDDFDNFEGAKCFAFAGLACFAGGLVCAILASIFAYLTQLMWGQAIDDSLETQREASAERYHVIAMGIAVLSAGAFAAGAVLTGLGLFRS